MKRPWRVLVAVGLCWLSHGAAGVNATATETSDIRIVADRAHGIPGAPEGVLDNYEIVLKLFAAEPEQWGGAYVDGDALIIKFANQSLDSALVTLHKSGVSGAFRLVDTETTYGELERATDALNPIAVGRVDLISWGPNYADSSISVETTGNALGLVDDLSKFESP